MDLQEDQRTANEAHVIFKMRDAWVHSIEMIVDESLKIPKLDENVIQ